MQSPTTKPTVVISEPCKTYVRIRRMVHPYEVVHTDTYAKNDYPPQTHPGVENIVSSDSPTIASPPSPSTTQARSTLDVTNPVDASLSSTFYIDEVFQSHLPRTEPKHASQETVFNTIGLQLLNDIMNGYNTSLLCIGPQGSGKTHTLFGPNCPDGTSILPPERDTGLIPRFISSLFDRIDKLENPTTIRRKKSDTSNVPDIKMQHLIEISCYEIRNEQVYDLLNPSDYDVQLPNNIHEHPKIGCHIQRLVTLTCTTAERCVEIMTAARSASATTNLFRGTFDDRDHVIYRFTITKRVNLNEEAKEGKEGKEGKEDEEKSFFQDPTNGDSGFSVVATFVDCASSCDRSLAMLDARSDRLHSKLHINTSWETTMKCMKTLNETSTQTKMNKNRSEPPYYASTLTSLLAKKGGPLGGDNRSYVIGHIGPSNVDYGTTMETMRCLQIISRVRNRPGIQKDATGKLTRGYRAHLSLVERELAQLQTDVPEWANPNSPMDENNENGIKMTQTEKESYINDRKAVWTEYRSDCERLAHDMIDTQLLLDRHEETWNARKQRSENEYRLVLRWLKGKHAMHGLKKSAFQSTSTDDGDSNNVPKKNSGDVSNSLSNVPRLISLHTNATCIGAQAIYLKVDGGRVTLGGATCEGMNINKSMCQISRDDQSAVEMNRNDSQSEDFKHGILQDNDSDDPDAVATPPKRATGLTVHVSPRADVYVNGMQILPNQSHPLYNNDILLLGVHRMYRIEALRGETTIGKETLSWYDGMRQLVSKQLSSLLKVEEKIVQDCLYKFEESKRRLEELQAQVSVEKRKIKQIESKHRRDLKKREKKGLGIDESEETRHRKEIDPLKRRVDTLEVTMLQRSGESEALKRRVSEAERGSRVLLPLVLKDLMALRQINKCMNATLGKHDHSFIPRLVPNHAKVTKMALHASGDHLMHGGADVELWIEVSQKDNETNGSPTRRPSRRRSRSPSRGRINSNSPGSPGGSGTSGGAGGAGGAGTKTTVMWNRDRFLLRYYLMIEMYNVYRLADGGDGDDKGTLAINQKYNDDNNPYILGSSSGHQVIGQSHMYIDSLSYFIEFEEVVAVIDFRGQEVGKLRIQVTPTVLAGVDLMLDEIDEQQTKSLRDYIGEKYSFVITIVDCRNLPSTACSNVYVSMSLPDLEGEDGNLNRTKKISKKNSKITEGKENNNNEDAPEYKRYHETSKHAHDTIHPAFDVPITVTVTITEHMCDALSTDMIEFTLHGCKPGSGHSIEEHEDSEFSKNRKRKNPIEHELYETKTQLNRMSHSLSITKLEMEECKLEARDKQIRAEELKRELGMMRKGTAAEKYRKEAKSLKYELKSKTDELESTKASLAAMEMKLSKSKTCLIS